MLKGTLLAALVTILPSVASGSDVATSAGAMRISPVLQGLDEPWGVAILPDGAILVTERGGRLLLAREGSAQPVAGLPEVYAEGQGGLLDVLIPADFATSREVWLSFAAPVGTGGATAAGKGRLAADGTRLEEFATVFLGEVSVLIKRLLRSTSGRRVAGRSREPAAFA